MPPAEPTVVVAVDVGGTGLKAAAVALEAGAGGPRASIRTEVRRPTPRGGADDVVAAVIDVVTELRAYRPAAAGVVVPGLVDEARGVAVFSANLGWRDVPFRQLVADRLDLPVGFGHDVRAAGLAEVRFGAGRGARDALFVPIGTGIAGAVVAGGRPVVGVGHAGEIGHVSVDPAGEPCACGGHGCLETVASAAAIARRYGTRAGRPVGGAVDVVRLMNAGDADAKTVWEEAMDALAGSLATAAAVTAPEVIVLGGGLAESGGLLVDAVRERLAARLHLGPAPRVVAAELGDRAGVYGAALLAADAYRPEGSRAG